MSSVLFGAGLEMTIHTQLLNQPSTSIAAPDLPGVMIVEAIPRVQVYAFKGPLGVDSGAKSRSSGRRHEGPVSSGV